MGLAMNKRKLDPDCEIYSQFTNKPNDFTDHMRAVSNPAVSQYDSQSHAQVLDSLAKNEFFDSENFQKFLMRKQGKGIRTKFLNRLTQENARDLMLEHRGQAD